MDFSNISGNVIGILEEYGWYILFGTAGFLYVYNVYLKDKIQNYRKWRSEQEYSAIYHKNPDLLEKRLKAQQALTEKLQEKYNQDAEEHKRKMEEKEARKKEEHIKKLEGKGHKLGSLNKPDYNPLMGAGTSGGYRPPKKGCCKKGGGCG